MSLGPLVSEEKTYTGLKKSDLKLNKRGKVVSKKAAASGQKRYKNIAPWTKACQQARKELGIKGFCPVGGKTAQGKARRGGCFEVAPGPLRQGQVHHERLSLSSVWSRLYKLGRSSSGATEGAYDASFESDGDDSRY